MLQIKEKETKGMERKSSESVKFCQIKHAKLLSVINFFKWLEFRRLIHNCNLLGDLSLQTFVFQVSPFSIACVKNAKFQIVRQADFINVLFWKK